MNEDLRMFLLSAGGGGLIGFLLFPLMGWWCLAISALWGVVVAEIMT